MSIGLVYMVAKHGLMFNILSEGMVGVQRYVENVVRGLKLLNYFTGRPGSLRPQYFKHIIFELFQNLYHD